MSADATPAEATPEDAAESPTEPRAPLPPKVDPDTLVLRGAPRRVVRFRREVIVGIAVVSAIAIAGVTWIALDPAALRLAASGEDMFEQRPARDPEALAGAPQGYDAVPKLGPPLPGDLGRPILAHQRKLDADAGLESDTAVQDAEASARERALAEQAAIRKSPVFMEVEGKGGASAILVPAALPATSAAGRASEEPPRVGSATAADPSVNPHRIQSPASPWIMSAGTLISASLITGINSDLPGTVVAQVTENAFDSVTGRTLLIPQGARLIGRYESRIAYGQRRAFVSWHRIIWPDGSSLRLEDVSASDTGGYAGLADKVDFHGGALLKGVALSTVLGVGTELGFGGNESDLVRAFRESAQTSGGRAGEQIVGRALDIEPTITIRPGWPLRVMLHTDLVLKPWRG